MDAKGGKTKQGWVPPIVLIIGVALFTYLLSFINFIEILDWKIYDIKFQAKGRSSVSDTPIAMVLIDQKTADSLKFPFDRSVYADLIENLDKLDARLIVFDIDFSSQGIFATSDSLLYEAIASRDNVVLSGKIDYFYHHGLKHPLTKVAEPSSTVAPKKTPFGLVNDLIDPDGVSRRYPLYLTSSDTAFFSLALKTYTEYKNWGKPLPKVENETLFINDMVIPLYGIPATLVNYYGPSGTFPSYSFVDVISGVYDLTDLLADLTDEERELLEMLGTADLFDEVTGDNPFKDKIVLVGASAEDLQDNKFTPFHSMRFPFKTPGVEVHANVLQMLLDRNFIKHASEWWVRLGILLIAVLLFFSSRKLSPYMNLLLAISIIIGILATSTYLFINMHLFLRDLPLILAVSIGYPANLIYTILQSQREKAMIRGMFGRYVPPQLVDALIQNPDMLNLGGEKRRLTILFTDVAGFTTISEKLTPEELVTLLNEYLTPMTKILKENGGTIDKYEGDLIMAEFGAPVWFKDHSARCCRAAILMQEKLKELRITWKEQNRPELYSRIGINTGDVIVGNMGSDDVFDYTVMGDAVNLASRLEGANKAYGSTIMIGYQTWLDVKDEFITRPLDLLKVKGKEEAVPVFELLAQDLNDLHENEKDAYRYFIKGIELFRNKQFKEALDQFERAFERNPKDSASHLYIERCTNYISTPPPDDWNGVFALTEK